VVAGFLGFITFEYVPTAKGATIYVPTDFPTIQDAINAAKDGDTVFVYSGTYNEDVVVNKTINLIGENMEFTIISGSGGPETVHVNANWVNITGFTITNFNSVVHGLVSSSDYNTILGNKFSNTRVGVRLSYSSGNNIINNIMSVSETGIYLSYSSGNNIMDNLMSDNGIYIEGDQLEHWNTHDIDLSNTVNGKPIYYWKNRTNGTISSGGIDDAGQVILANCTNVTVEAHVITDVTVGISLGFSSNNNIINNNIYSTIYWYGIGLYYSSGNNIMGNFGDSNRNKGLYLNHSGRNNISRNTFSNSPQDNGIHLINSHGNYITDNTLSSNSDGAGIYLWNSSENYIIGNNVSSNLDGIHLCWGSSNNTVENNTCAWNQYGAIELHLGTGNSAINNHVYKNDWGISIAYSNETDLINNNVSDNKRGGISVDNTYRNNIIGNTIISNSENGIWLWRSHENYVYNNNITSSGEFGIYLFISERNTIHDNNIQKSNIHGVYLWGYSNNNIITDNIISSNNYDGILLDVFSSNTTITGNHIFNNSRGINLSTPSVSPENTSYNIIKDNNIMNNGLGIRLSSSTTNAIIGNNISLNNGDGIRLLNSSDMNVIIGNTVFSNNGYGIYLSESSRNNIYHNYILNNTIQAYDNRNDTNQWDNGYPSGGNYWSDFDEPIEGAYDEYNGPDQLSFGSDGIVDNGTIGGGGKNPYVIDSDSQDNYPLILPPAMTPILYIDASVDRKDAILYWDQPSIFGLSHYLIYRSENQTNFDFSDVWVNTQTDKQPGESTPSPLRTTWIDINASVPGDPNYKEQYYYVIRGVSDSGKMSPSSRTVGKWTRSFPKGVSTFSLPLEPIDPLSIDYCTLSMNAIYMRYMDPNQHIWRQHNFGDGGKNNTQMRLGEGYEVKLSSQTVFTFTGLPGAMISYYGNGGFFGFDPATEADCLVVTIQANGDVNLNWQEPAGMAPGDYYEIYYSNKRDGFSGYLDFDYFKACPPVAFGTNIALHVGAKANDPGNRLYYMVVPFNAVGVRGASTYSIGIWTEEYLAQYDTFGIPLKLSNYETTDWYCDNIPDTVGINYFIYSQERWGWHSTRMPEGAFDPILEMTEGYQISTSGPTKFTFIGV
jgi:parallel beta-helix repeat protein